MYQLDIISTAALEEQRMGRERILMDGYGRNFISHHMGEF